MEFFKLRQRIHDRTRPPLVIFPITLADPAIVEIAGYAGAEAVLLDCEHGSINPQAIRAMISAAAAAGTAAVYRPRSFDAAACRQALDAGAAGCHVSHVDTAEQARAAVDACRYAPLGRREMSLGRAVHYIRENLKPYVQQANDDQLLVVMIETIKAVENVDAIAAVPGIDVLHIGAADLSHDMGHVCEYDTPRFQDAVDKVLAAAQNNGITAGFPTDDPDLVADLTRKGMRFFEADTPDWLLREVYADRLAALNAVFKKL
ncbi:MAG: siderophore biosynthesis protein SbnG [Planctomycetaceae bacterium]|nr:siderophore biosynthesis protein SbnG [Planctomycetaceae bacterium]